MIHYLFQVIGQREYRGHRTGDQFEARMDAAIGRALDRRDIELICAIDPSIREGDYRLPDDWPPTAADATHTTEAPRGASLIRRD